MKRGGEQGESGQGAPIFPYNVSSFAQQTEGSSKQAVEGMRSGAGNLVQPYNTVDRSQQVYAPQGEASVFPGALLKRPSRTRLGFTMAGIFIGAGALILIIVFIMAQSLPVSAGVEVHTASQSGSNNVVVVATPSPEQAPTILSITPKPDEPGAKYIDNIQIGTTMNMSRVEITQVTKDFKAGQKIYITMDVNRAGYQGAVCLDWYVQNTFLTHYAFATTADPSLPHSAAWSYAIAMRRGPGYVNVSWASSVACSDKVMAQKVDFTIG